MDPRDWYSDGNVARQKGYVFAARTSTVSQTTIGRERTFRDAGVAAGFVLLVNVVGALPAALFGANTRWFEEPWFFPPTIAFPIVWTLLFTLLGVALFFVWRSDAAPAVTRNAYTAFVVQFALNLAWTPAFFGLQRPDLGLVVIVGLWIAVAGTIAAFDRVDRRAALLCVPYLAWVTFAAVLNYAILVG